MTNKITVPSELIHRAIDAIEQVGYQDKFIDYTFVRAVKQELRDALDEPTRGIDHETMRARYTDPEALDLSSGTGSTLRFVVADPVPPAIAEPRLLPRRDESMGTAERDDYANGYRHAWNAACDAWEPHVARLQAEVERLKERQALLEIAASQVVSAKDHLQAELTKLGDDYCKRVDELTKALELLADVAKTPWMYDVLGSVREYVANQSAPADKGQGEAPPFGWWRTPQGLPLQGMFLHYEPEHSERDIQNAINHGFTVTRLYAEQPAPVAVVMPEKYDDVLLPFLSLMRAELHANARKGDRPGWLQMDRKTAVLEVFYHMGKLHMAVHRNDKACIKEYAADVANMCMMLTDVCGCLNSEPKP